MNQIQTLFWSASRPYGLCTCAEARCSAHHSAFESISVARGFDYSGLVKKKRFERLPSGFSTWS